MSARRKRRLQTGMRIQKENEPRRLL